MIVVRLMGGLGNQMFQYATGRAIADQLNLDLLLDIRGFGNYKLHAYGLERFNIRARHATNQELREWPEWQRRLAHFSNKLRFKSRWLLESNYQFDPRIQSLLQNVCSRSVYLDGYFQSYKYFTEIEERLAADFHLKANLSQRNQDILDGIASSQSVALHVRRGDYVTNENALKIHGLCSIEYYKTAISYIRKQVNQACFFVFSNDTNWAKANLPLGSEAVYIEGNLTEPEVDILLMSKCRHHIIANSSFSWWGAWLAQNHEKICIAPTPWFNDIKMKEIDLIPNSWVRMNK